jgi:hypothetical protein
MITERFPAAAKGLPEPRSRILRPCSRILMCAVLIAACAIPRVLAENPAAASFPYRLDMSPEEPEAGSILELTITVEGMNAADMQAVLSLDSALRIEAQSLRPRPDPATGSRVAELRVDIRILKPGRHRIESILLSGSEGSLNIGPVFVETRRGSGREPEIGPMKAGLPAWHWKSPKTVHRHEAFSLRL